jgi:hypothetical protein
MSPGHDPRASRPPSDPFATMVIIAALLTAAGVLAIAAWQVVEWFRAAL